MFSKFKSQPKPKSYSKDQTDDAIEATLIVVKIIGASILIVSGIMAFVL